MEDECFNNPNPVYYDVLKRADESRQDYLMSWTHRGRQDNHDNGDSNQSIVWLLREDPDRDPEQGEEYTWTEYFQLA